MSFRLYDEQRLGLVEFEPIVPGEVSIYHCGLTVQAAPHLGHMRKEVVFDVLRRWFVASGYKVRIVSNVTDINDKIEKKAAEAGIEWFELAFAVELELHQAYMSLGVAPPNYQPRASQHITEQIALVEQIIANGHGYAADDGTGDVYFDVKSWPSYGELTHLKLSEMRDDDEADSRGKRDPRDFALWKGRKDGDPESATWPSPWGPGRPGWHLECSAMALKYLGAAFDIHGGGLDLRFPHHENELAQSRAAGHPFATYWMHNAFVTTGADKMSKSLGNTTTVGDVTAKYPARAVRLFLVAPHYRSLVELSMGEGEDGYDSLVETAAQLKRIDSFLDRAGATGPVEFDFADLPAEFVAAMDDDLGTPAAVAAIFDAVKAGNKALDVQDAAGAQVALRAVRAMLHVLGLDPYDPEWQQTGGADLEPVVAGLVPLLLDQRSAAKANKDWATADAIRDRLIELGIKIEDSAESTKWSLA
ncbi:MAG: cysteine--tRNA ligase [Propionibacteriaceae bacterium]|jgi:cysteinyl-tRNA synthetase|nr:cysteine--tRNA ligase [Propionibacteriaceae bacterium]